MTWIDATAVVLTASNGRSLSSIEADVVGHIVPMIALAVVVGLLVEHLDF